MKTRQIIGIVCLVLGVIGFLCVKSSLNPESSVETHNPLYNFLIVILLIWTVMSLLVKILMVADKKTKYVSTLSTICFGIAIVLLCMIGRTYIGIATEWSVMQSISFFVWITSWVIIDVFDATVEPKQKTR